MQEELRALSGTLRQFLFAHLPEAYPDWWSSGVMGALSF